ncbi:MULTISPECIES: hypothetical protein [Photorhabdus]|uniref:DUF4424 domain-containing protein n=2 Tax=Photorhabdus TaxID=29487 RepID=A0ABX0AXE9_9GAMM|nr:MULTISPECIES: hypothetical protein [Photorhabdus]MCC8376230.1 hypothetical protein [Photorhabdus bodei]MCT8350849.1 hypothetical protein [Photorhabdus kayaii]MDB6366693.1 hypothetical protein [Photorhabdus bodei]MDB6372895.1 hypothetical protein [Photorhabdus bodei]NDL11888.1 hypothetical protein [Photorhabdus kayaii]
MKKEFLFFIALFSLSAYGRNTMDQVKYITYLETHRARCVLRVNGMYTLSSLHSITGTISTGYNIAPLLQNGKNTIYIEMAPFSDAKEGYIYKDKDAECKVRLVRMTPYQSDEITNIIASVADKNGIAEPNSMKSVNFNVDTAQYSKITEKNLKDEGIYYAERTVTLNDLPVWAWTMATPLPETEASTELVRKAYEDIWQIMKNKDLVALQSSAKLMLHEHALANNSTEQVFFDSLDFKQDFDNNYQAVPIDWSKYKLIRYMGGRLFRFQLEHSNNSPLLIEDKNNSENGRTFSPYFSLINGKVVISR